MDANLENDSMPLVRPAAGTGGNAPAGGPVADASGDERRGRGRPQPEESASEGDGSPDEMTDGACPSITHHKTRQVVNADTPQVSAVLAFDWFETAGCMAHGSRSKPLFDELERLQKMAEYHRAPYPLAMGDGCWLVYERGMGSGPSVHYEFRLEYLGVTIGLSSRADSSRHLSNFYIKIPGESCVIHGAEELRRRIFNFFESFDLDLVDEWIRRIDICLDLSEWNWDDTFAVACEAKQYVGTIRNTAPYRIGQETTGLTAQTGTLKLTIYDKLRETFAKKSEAYQQAMIQTRWGGKVPASATRIEYQIRRGWFADKEGFKTTQGVLDRLADVISHITRFESHPPFVLTSTVPDRKGRHQDRAEVLPDWRRAIEAMRELAGQPRRPVERLNRSMMTAIKSVQNAIGYILTAASQLELVVENVGDLEAVFHELLECNAIDDEVLSLKWSDKARRAGTLRKVTEFPFGANVAI